MFDIVSASSDLDSAVDSSLTPEEKFSRALLEMQPGDELAFRGGRHRLSGSSPLLRNRKAGARLSKSGEDAITKISVVATGQGITPSVQFIRYALDSLGSSNADDLPFGRPVVRANSCELLWLNEKEDDYTSENEIKDFEYRYGNRFKSSKVLESDLYSPDVVRNGNLRKYISEYTPGSIAVICAPEHLVEQFRFLYRELGYPVDSILSIMTN